MKSRGILPWLDEWELLPGMPWQKVLESQIGTIKSAAVFIGPIALGPWEDMEQYAFLHEFIGRGRPIIPVYLPGRKRTPRLPPFLSSFHHVDFRNSDPDPLDQLIWGITGERKY